MMRRVALAAITGAVMTMPMAASAFQHERTTFSGGFMNFTFEGENARGPVLSFESEFAFGNGFGGSVIGTYAPLSFEDVDFDFTVTRFGLIPTYEVAPNVELGGYLVMNHVEFSTLFGDGSFEFDEYGLQVGYRDQGFDVLAYLGSIHADELTEDVLSVGLAVDYIATPELGVFGEFQYDNFDSGSDTLTRFAFGFVYDLSSVVGAPVTVEGSYGLIDFAGEDVDQIYLGVNYSLGGSGQFRAPAFNGGRSILGTFPLT